MARAGTPARATPHPRPDTAPETQKATSLASTPGVTGVGRDRRRVREAFGAAHAFPERERSLLGPSELSKPIVTGSPPVPGDANSDLSEASTHAIARAKRSPCCPRLACKDASKWR